MIASAGLVSRLVAGRVWLLHSFSPPSPSRRRTRGSDTLSASEGAATYFFPRAIHDAIFTKIDFEWDRDTRTARISVPDVVRAETAPTRNPVTDEEHRILTVLPDGWVF